MEFTNHQHQSFKRLSRLGVVAALHVVLLAVVLNDMKIKITLPHVDPLIVKFEEPKLEKTVTHDPVIEPTKSPPLKFPVIDPPVVDGPVIHTPPPKTTDSDGARINPGKGDAGSGGETTGTSDLPVQAKVPVHVAAVVDMSRCEKPVYPASSIRNGEEGTVTLAMLIGANGRVMDTRTEASSGHRNLDRSASQALSLCRFTPGTIDGVPQQSWTKVQYVWKIDG
ncbi:energy transducer TonB [Undibacterium sp. Ji50W]|uniref:energy transducer TonB n=1 Tax=Undibacterium sp. Ji50W TaxID=3413041 RepID=UPI003BF42677